VSLLIWGSLSLSDERTSLSFLIAGGPRQRSHSWSESRWIRDHILLSQILQCSCYPVYRFPRVRLNQHFTCCIVASIAISTGRPSQASSTTFERPWQDSQPSCEPLYATDTSHRKQETFIHEYPLRWVILPTKKHNRTLFFGSMLRKHSRHFDNLFCPEQNRYTLILSRWLCDNNFHISKLPYLIRGQRGDYHYLILSWISSYHLH
jgi:hypothetical protein